MKKTLLIILLLVGFNSYSQSKFIELTYTLNTPYKFRETKSIEGRVIVTRKGSIERYIVIVSHNSTYKIWISDIELFKLIKDKEFLVLKNCKYLR